MTPYTREQRWTLLLAALSTALVLVTFVTPLGTLGRTAADLGSGGSVLPWLLSAMSLGLAVALLVSGSIADDRGRRRVFVVGLAVLAVGALVCATAGHSLVFIAGRLVQGVGGAAVMSCALGLIGHAFPPGPGRAHATGIWGASVGAGIGTSCLLATVVDPGTSWRSSYLVTVLLGLVLAVAARVLLVESAAQSPRPPDLWGAGLLGAGLTALLAGLVQTRQGWSDPASITLLVTGVVGLTAFVGCERRVAAPMLDLALFHHPAFVAATVGALANGAGAISLASFLPTLVQQGLGGTLLAASLLIGCFAGSSVVVALNVKRLPVRVTGRMMLAVGLAGVSAGQLTMIGLTTDSTAVRLLPGVLVSGVFFGLLNAALGREAVASVPPERASTGSGINNTARYVGAAIGLSLVAAIVTGESAGPGPEGLVAGWNAAVWVTAGLSTLGALVVLASRPARVR